jgi:NitT/TauT family transport system substrate-binding protein
MRTNPVGQRIALVLVGLLLVLSGCAGIGGPAQPVTIRTGYIPILIYAPLFVGIERSYFAQEDITLELTPLQSGNEAVVQLAAGNFDVALGGVGAGLFNAAARGVDFTIVAPLHSERPPVVTSLVISAKRTGEITSVADLKGKKVAVNGIGAGTEYWLAQALAQGGLTFADIQLEGVPFANVPPALESGTLDAAMLAEPITTINVDQGVVAVLSDDFVDGFTATYVYMGELLKQRPEVAKKFLRAYLRAVRDLQGEYMTDEIAAIIEQYTKVPAAVLKRLPRPQYDPNGVVPTGDIDTMQQFFLGRGLLEYDQPLDMRAFIDASIAAEVAAGLDAGK